MTEMAFGTTWVKASVNSIERLQLANLEPEAPRAVTRAARAVKSKSGQALLEKRGELIERGWLTCLNAVA